MSDSDSELPLPAPRDDGDSDSSSSSSSSSSLPTNEIPIPPPLDESFENDNEHHNGSVSKEILDEIPYPTEEAPEVEIPLPPDSSKYSPSQATGEDDCLGISTTTESKKQGPTVLGKAQAKKRLLAFSAAKLGSSPVSSVQGSKKITPTKATILQQKASKQAEQQLAIETIKQEETKMKEILAMNSILNQKLKQVNAITHNIPTTPPVTAIVKPTVITPIPLDTTVSKPSLIDVILKSPERSSRKSTKNIRKAHHSSSGSRSHSRGSSKSPSPSLERRSSKKSRKSKSRSRSRDRKEKKERREKERDKRGDRDKKSRRTSRSRSKEREPEKRRKSRSKSKERESERRRKSRSKERESERRRKSRSKSKERDSEKRRKSRSKSKERESEKRRKSRSRSKEQLESEKRRKSHSKSRSKERDLEKRKKSRSRSKELESEKHRYREKDRKKSRRSKSRSNERESRRDKDKKTSRDDSVKLKDKEKQVEKEHETKNREKSKSDRKKDQEKEERRLEEKKQLEKEQAIERELDKVRKNKMPNDWTEFTQFQYRLEDVRSIRAKLHTEQKQRNRSLSRSLSHSPTRISEEPSPYATSMSKGSNRFLNTISVKDKSELRVDYPAFLVKTTKVKPNLTYGCAPFCSEGYYKTRAKVFEEEDNSIVDVMSEIINSNSKPSLKESTTTKSDTRDWFSANSQVFCPPGGTKAVLISHLYSDDEGDDSPAPIKNVLDKSQTKKEKKPISPTSVESHEEDNDSMDSAPSPLLKRKYISEESVYSPPRSKKKTRRSQEPMELEEIPLCKDPPPPSKSSARESTESLNDKPEVKPKKRDEKERKRDDEKDKHEKKHDSKKDRSDEKDRKKDTDKDKDKKRKSEKDRKRDVDKDKNREEVADVEKKRDEKVDKDKSRHDEKHKKREDKKKDEVEKKSKRNSIPAEETEDIPLMKEKSTKSEDSATIKEKEKVSVKNKKKHDDKDNKKSKKKHRKRRDSSSSESESESSSSSKSSSSEEASSDSDESDHKGKSNSKRKKLKKKKRSKGSKKDKSKTRNRDKSPDSSDDDKGGRHGGGGGSHSKDGKSSKDSKSHRDRDQKDSKSKKHDDRDKERRPSSHHGRRRAKEPKDGDEWEDGELASTSATATSDVESNIATEDLILMNPPNPNATLLEEAALVKELDSFKPNNLISDSEKMTHELLSTFDDDLLLQSILQDSEITAEKLLLNISKSDSSDSENHHEQSISAAKPFVSWSDDSEEEALRMKQQSEGELNTTTTTNESPSSGLFHSPKNDGQTPSSTSRASTSGYETERKKLVVDEQHDDRPHLQQRNQRARDEIYDREYKRKDYYDNRSRLLKMHVYDRRGDRRGFNEDRYHHRSSDRRDSRNYRDRPQYRSSYRSFSSSQSRHDRVDRRRDVWSPERRVRRYSTPPPIDKLYYDEKERIPSNFPLHHGATETESPPVQLNVADSTISDSELQIGNNHGGSHESCSFVNTIPEMPVTADIYQYDQFIPDGVVAGQFQNSSFVSTDIVGDVVEGVSSPKRLSLDERLEIEMGFNQGEFLPVPRPNEATNWSDPQAEPTVNTTIHHQGRVHSHIIQTGSMIQVVPVEIPSVPVTIRSTLPVESQFDIYGNPIGVDMIPGQPPSYPPRRVITIKVPIMPFTVPVQEQETISSTENESKESKRKKSSKSGKQKRKREASSSELERAKRKKLAEAKLIKKSKHKEVKLAQEEELKLPKVEASEEATKSSTPPQESENISERIKLEEASVSEIPQEASSTEKSGDEKIMSSSICESKENVAPETEPLRKVEILPAPERGILVLLGFRDRTAEERKNVKFADGVDPGCGTSSSGGEEMASPPPSFGKDPTVEAAQLKKKLKRKKKKKKFLAEQTDLFAPPSCPDVPYPFCPPGILYQVCPQYAVLYAHAMAEKGLDIVFEPTTELPYNNDNDKTATPNNAQELEQKQQVVSQVSTFNNNNNCSDEVAALPYSNNITPICGIDFSQPPPSLVSDNTNNFELLHDPTFISHYEAPPTHHNSSHSYTHSHSTNSNYSHYNKHASHYNDNNTGGGSRIPTIVTRQPTTRNNNHQIQISESSQNLLSPRSPRLSTSQNSYSSGSGSSSVSSISTVTTVGQNIEVLVRNSTTPNIINNNIFPAVEEKVLMMPHQNNNLFKPIPPLMSPQLVELTPPMNDYNVNANNNIALPFQHEEAHVSRPSSLVFRERGKRRKDSASAPSSTSNDSISIPLSKIISNSSIPSLSKNSPHRIERNKQHPQHRNNNAYHHHSSQNRIRNNAISITYQQSNFTNFDFTPCENNKSKSKITTSTTTSYSNSNPNLISVTPQPYQQIPKTIISPPKSSRKDEKSTQQRRIPCLLDMFQEPTPPSTPIISSSSTLISPVITPELSSSTPETNTMTLLPSMNENEKSNVSTGNYDNFTNLDNSYLIENNESANIIIINTTSQDERGIDLDYNSSNTHTDGSNIIILQNEEDQIMRNVTPPPPGTSP